MHRATTISVRDRWKKLPSHESGWLSGSPPATASSRPITPMMVASVILPLRHTYIHMPMNMPSGMVMAIVNTPHALSASALTKVMPRPEIAMIRMNRMAIDAMNPMKGPISGLDDVGERLAAAAHRRPQHDRVVHRAGETDARDQPDQARRVAELRRQHRADQRARAGDRREVVAEHHPPRGRVVVGAVVLGVRWSLARVIQHVDLGCQERAVVAIRDGQDAQRGQEHIQSMHKWWR